MFQQDSRGVLRVSYADDFAPTTAIRKWLRCVRRRHQRGYIVQHHPSLETRATALLSMRDSTRRELLMVRRWKSTVSNHEAARYHLPRTVGIGSRKIRLGGALTQRRD